MLRLTLRALLALSGLAVVAVGLNVGLGGIQTLGMQTAPGFVKVLDEASFAIQDSHVRFLGGLFAVVGGVLTAGAFLLPRLWSAVCLLCALMPVAGLFRLSGGGNALSSELYTSLGFEFVLFPLLAIGVWRAFGRNGDHRPE